MVEVYSETQTTEILCTYDGLLISIFCADVETATVISSRNGEVIVLNLCCTEDDTLTIVGVLLLWQSQAAIGFRTIRHKCRVLTIINPCLIQDLCRLRTCSEVPQLSSFGKTIFRSEVNTGFLSLTASFGSNKNNTISASGTINGGGIRILQHLDFLNIIRIKVGEGVDGLSTVRDRLQWLTVDGYTIDDVKRIVSSIDGGGTTQANKHARTWCAR